MSDYSSLSPLIANDRNEVIIYGADNFPQYPTRQASVGSKCDRALSAASCNDIVVLRGQLDLDYHRWLRALGLSTDLVVEYHQPASGRTLSELIVENPDPIDQIVRRLGKKPIYVPWFSTRQEALAADALGADLFGAAESETMKYNDKQQFKILCREIEIPVIEGAAFSIQPNDNANFREMEGLVHRYLAQYDTVIIRGTLGVSGMSLYKTQGKDLACLYETIVASGEEVVLIEPFLKASESPNDQWVVDRDGEISHIGMISQECRQGLVHVGNLKGPQPAADIYKAITEISHRIVTHMAKSGYCGVIGIDYIVSREGIFPVENNARFNGSSYVNMLVHNIEDKMGAIPFWKFSKINIKPCSFSALKNQLAPILYDGDRPNSVIPATTEELEQLGAFALVMLAQDMKQLHALQSQLETAGITC